jgi:hypothetical protein
MTQIAEEIRSAVHHQVVICDRSVLDNYAYMLLACGAKRAFETLCRHWMKGYDLLFKVPISGQASADGVRDTDEFFMHSIDQIVDRLLKDWNVPHEKLPPGEREDWARQAGDAVRRHPKAAALF